MFIIEVDGIENSRHSPTCAAITVGSAPDAQVRLPSAAEEHLKIYPMTGSYEGCFKVTVHAPEGMTQHTKHWTGTKQTVQWTTDREDWLVGTHIHYTYPEGKKSVFVHGHERPGWVLVRGGDTMTVNGFKIQVINYCGTCGRKGMPFDQLWQCTCARRRT